MILNSRVVAFARQREITGEPLNSRSWILAPNRREITGVDCINNWIEQVVLYLIGPRRCGCNLKLVTKNRYLEQFFWNCHQVNVRRPHRWLFQVVALCLQATSHYLKQCWPRSILPYCITRPQWVNTLRSTIYNLLNLDSVQINQKQYVYLISFIVSSAFVLCCIYIIICRYCNRSVVSSAYHWILHAQITSSYAINLHIASTTSKSFLLAM